MDTNVKFTQEVDAPVRAFGGHHISTGGIITLPDHLAKKAVKTGNFEVTKEKATVKPGIPEPKVTPPQLVVKQKDRWIVRGSAETFGSKKDAIYAAKELIDNGFIRDANP